MEVSTLLDELTKKQIDLFKLYYQEGTPVLDEIKNILGQPQTQAKGGMRPRMRRTRRKNRNTRNKNHSSGKS
jgi:hypothetical protein